MGAVLLVSALVIVFGVKFASDVLDMLPQGFDSVQVFKLYDREFSQARELTFGIYDESKQADLDAFAEYFGDELRKEPWVVRVMDRSPMESNEGQNQLNDLALPLLLNLSQPDFERALAGLAPEAISARLHQLRLEFESGSPKAQYQLEADPLGLLASAMRPLANSFTIEQTRPLVSPDGTLHVVSAITTQKDLGAHACQRTMADVEAFKRRILVGWSGPKPEVVVTGRTPYVSELSLKMRGDVISTLLTSVVLVSLVFWIGFRRIRPLLGIMHVLMLCCVVAVALGACVFHELNMITIGLCSILIGLGVDFGMMLYSIYEAERDAGHDHESAIRQALRSQGRAVIFGAITSAAAFICLVLSECPGFAQLGVLIAFGIVFAGIFMLTVFFAMIGRNHKPRPKDPVRMLGERFVNWVFRRPATIFCATATLLTGLSVVGFAPIGELKFNADPKSLEPANSDAGRALRLITSKMPVGEPWIGVVAARDEQQLYDAWRKLQSSWASLVSSGRLKSAATPAGFVLSPEHLRANSASLKASQIEASRAALVQAVQAEGMKVESFQATFDLLTSLSAIADGRQPPSDLRTPLPVDSPWRFVLDHFFGSNPLVAVGYATPAKKPATQAAEEALRDAMNVPGVDVHYSGWSYTLVQLVHWAKKKLVELSVVMVGFNILLLVFLYRRAFPLFALMASLLLSVGAMVASLKFTGASLNLFNVLAFPLVLGVGVDYGIYVVIAMRAKGNLHRSTAMIFKPVLLSGLTAVAGFGSLGLAENPALRGLGVVCAFGIAWCLFATFFFIMPLYAWRGVE